MIFFFSTYSTAYPAGCPQEMRVWLPVCFAQFYAVQLLVYYFLTTKKINQACVLFLVTSFVLMPWIVVFTVWGNILIAALDNTPTCQYD